MRLSQPEPTARGLFGDFAQAVVMLPSDRASLLGMTMTTFVAIDFETATHRRDSACAVGLAAGCNGRIVASRTYAIRPPTPQFSFTGIHGVRWEDVRDAPTFGDLWQRYARGSTTRSSWPPTTRRSIGVSSSRVARHTDCVHRGYRSSVLSSLLAHNGESTRRSYQTSAGSFVFCSITTTPGRMRKRAHASCSPPRLQGTRQDRHPRRNGRGLRPPGQLSRPYLVADDPRRAGRTAHLACAPSGSCAWPRIPGSFAAPRGMHAVPAHQGGHPLSRLPLIDDGVVRCANQGCTLCLADTDPVAE